MVDLISITQHKIIVGAFDLFITDWRRAFCGYHRALLLIAPRERENKDSIEKRWEDNTIETDLAVLAGCLSPSLFLDFEKKRSQAEKLPLVPFYRLSSFVDTEWNKLCALVCSQTDFQINLAVSRRLSAEPRNCLWSHSNGNIFFTVRGNVQRQTVRKYNLWLPRYLFCTPFFRSISSLASRSFVERCPFSPQEVGRRNSFRRHL